MAKQICLSYDGRVLQLDNSYYIGLSLAEELKQISQPRCTMFSLNSLVKLAEERYCIVEIAKYSRLLLYKPKLEPNSLVIAYFTDIDRKPSWGLLISPIGEIAKLAEISNLHYAKEQNG